MAIFAVLLILISGYIYAQAVPYERIKLKRSNGWEAYVYLAKHGLSFLFTAVMIVTAVFFLSFVIELFLSIFDRTLYLDIMYRGISFSEKTNTNVVIITIITLLSFRVGVTEARLKSNDNNWLEILRKEDGMLNVIIESMAEHRTVKVSLKSRKIYIGLIQSEQFESTDLENIVIIPYISGYRDKDKLRIFFDCNYITVYINNNMLSTNSPLNEGHMRNLDRFRLVIRVDEIESISLFDASYYKQFKFNESDKTDES